MHVFLLDFAGPADPLLEQALAGLGAARVPVARETLPDAGVYLEDPEGLDRLMAAPESELAPLREAYWRRGRAAGVEPSGAVVLDTHLFNGLRLPLLARLFPGARILSVARDPREVVLGCLRRRSNVDPTAHELTSLEGCARLYRAAMRISGRTVELAGLPMHLVRRERLGADFEGETARLHAFLGLDPRAPQAGPASPAPGAAERWPRYADQLAPVVPVLAPWIERLGDHTGAP